MLLHLFSRVGRLVAGVAILLSGALAPTLAAAQATPTPPRVYSGPRYPGGPDSLRAVVGRQLRSANPAWVGNVFLQLQLDANGAVQKAQYLPPPPGTPAATLVRNAEVQSLAAQVMRQLLHWQASPGVIRLSSWRFDTMVLPLPFGRTQPTPLAYSDEPPTFAAPGQRLTQDYPTDAVAFLQRQFRYPAEALRARTQGKVFLYFEVSETGIIEQRQVVGSLSSSVDAEALRALNLLPNASSPPRQQGRPVRVCYVVPLTLAIQ